MLEALARESSKLELLGRKISPERQENLVRGRLVLNTLCGRDDGTQSAKLLGADRRISMWQADSQVGLVVSQAPPQMMVSSSRIKHEVPLLPDDQPEEE